MQKPNWLQILIECKNKVQEQVALYTKTPKQAQPDLGIGAGGDPIKPIDIVAENAIVDTLREHKISFTFISEESGVKELGENPRC